MKLLNLRAKLCPNFLTFPRSGYLFWKTLNTKILLFPITFSNGNQKTALTGTVFQINSFPWNLFYKYFHSNCNHYSVMAYGATFILKIINWQGEYFILNNLTGLNTAKSYMCSHNIWHNYPFTPTPHHIIVSS